MKHTADDLIISDFGTAEFSAVVSRDVRMGVIDSARGKSVLAEFDAWCQCSVTVIKLGSRDIARADALVRIFETKLNVPDALHLAIAANAGLTIVTLDQRMVDAAQLQRQACIQPA